MPEKGMRNGLTSRFSAPMFVVIRGQARAPDQHSRLIDQEIRYTSR